MEPDRVETGICEYDFERGTGCRVVLEDRLDIFDSAPILARRRPRADTARLTRGAAPLTA
jgi:hypothetical protein